MSVRPDATMLQIETWYVMQRRQLSAHRMMHYTVVNSVQAAWHSKQWRQQYWRNPVQPVATCSDRAAEEKQDDAGKTPAVTCLPLLNSLLCWE